MPIVINERNRARKINGRQAQREFWIKGVTDEGSARSALLADADNCPPILTHRGVNYILDIENLNIDEADTLGDGTTVTKAVYLAQATWINERQGYRPAGTFQLSFDITGQSTRIYQSRETVHTFAASGKTAPNFKQAIGYQEDDTIEGCDILVPYFTFTVNATLSNATIQDGWVLTAADIVGTVNKTNFQGFLAGELLLYRVSGQQRPEEQQSDWDVSLGFAVSRNEDDLPDIGDITGITKDGWDYLWVYYETQVDTSTKRSHRVPIAAYVERVYRRKEYADLAVDG